MNFQDILVRPASRELIGEIAIGVAIKEVAPNRRHVGLVYDFDGEPRLLHLAWHHIVEDKAFPLEENYLIIGLGIELDKLAKTVLIGFLNTVESSIGLVPYGIDFENVIGAINLDGTLAELPLGKGMTCATFIAAALNAARYMPVKPETWVRDNPDDIEWHNWIIGQMQEYGVAENHIQAVRNDIGCKRLRPEQIAGACSNSEWPVPYELADEISVKVLSALTFQQIEAPESIATFRLPEN